MKTASADDPFKKVSLETWGREWQKGKKWPGGRTWDDGDLRGKRFKWF